MKSCPRCQQGIQSGFIAGMTIVCESCGFVVSNAERNSQLASRHRVVVTAFSFALLMIVGLWQVTVWDSYALEAAPLQIRELAGTINDTGRERLAEICMERKRFACVEHEYAVVAKNDTSKIFRLAKFQIGRHRWDKAVQSFTLFFRNGGSDIEAAFLFARALAHEGEVDEAGKYFKYVLNSHPDEVLKSAAIEGFAQLSSARTARRLASQPK